MAVGAAVDALGCGVAVGVVAPGAGVFPVASAVAVADAVVSAVVVPMALSVGGVSAAGAVDVVADAGAAAPAGVLRLLSWATSVPVVRSWRPIAAQPPTLALTAASASPIFMPAVCTAGRFCLYAGIVCPP